jgi:hypothetical protein
VLHSLSHVQIFPVCLDYARIQHAGAAISTIHSTMWRLLVAYSHRLVMWQHVSTHLMLLQYIRLEPIHELYESGQHIEEPIPEERNEF